MAMADWIHNYPRVAVLMQREGDVLDGASVEDAGGAPVAVQLETLYRAYLAAQEQYGPVYGWGLCSAGTYEDILHAWDPQHGVRGLEIDGGRDGCAMPFVTYKGIPLALVPRHMMDATSHGHGARYLRLHWNWKDAWRLQRIGDTACWAHRAFVRMTVCYDANLPVYVVASCQVTRGEPLCPCGAYLLEWR